MRLPVTFDQLEVSSVLLPVDFLMLGDHPRNIPLTICCRCIRHPDRCLLNLARRFLVRDSNWTLAGPMSPDNGS